VDVLPIDAVYDDAHNFLAARVLSVAGLQLPRTSELSSNPTNPYEKEKPMSEANKALVRRAIDETINKGNLSVVDEIVSADYVYREPTVGEKRGRAGLRELITMYRNVFPGVKLTIDEQVAEGDKVVTRWNATGTHRGELFGTAPTGKQIRWQGITVSRIANGRIVEETEVYDALGMLRQLGVVPATVGKAA